MLIDVHAHFYTDQAGRTDWSRLNRARLVAGERIGITAHVASILGTYGERSPMYFPSPEDVSHANDAMLRLQEKYIGLVYGYCLVNPNFSDHAMDEIDRRIRAGMIGVKLAASRRANDELLDPIAQAAGDAGVPILHHVWQHRRRDWPGQEASDAIELAELAGRHPKTRFILAHLGGGGDWAHTIRVVEGLANLWTDLSGSGIDVDMIERALEVLGPERLLWGTDLTMATGWGKLRFLESLGLDPMAVDAIRHGNAFHIFPEGAFS